MANRLINETSPYLLQHANNPVNWFPWGPEALELAQKNDIPILLSVGYSACHWCHVMERESFMDVGIANLMNSNFICIKVDREERPDIDSIYMMAVQALTGHGGWPMTVFLTSETEPFYGGTYFPPEDRGGMPGFPKVLETMARIYRENREDVGRTAQQLINRIEQFSLSGEGSIHPSTVDIRSQAFRILAKQFDPEHGGLGTQPKFPQPMNYEFILRYYQNSQDPEALEIVETTLDNMSNGGIYDQIGGGFHRYSTDGSWLVPHFEKMLYDNALLVKLYLHAYQVTRKSSYKRIVENTLDYVVREMRDSLGGFYSAQDADSEGIEGKFFVWTPEDIENVLGTNDGKIINEYFGVTKQGNFEGRSILHIAKEAQLIGAEYDLNETEFEELLKQAQLKLLDARNKRVAPDLDNKILTSWNGMMLGAFAEASAVLRRRDYIEIANLNAKFLLEHLQHEGRLLRSYRDGTAKLKGYLEDYAFLIDGLISLHEITFEEEWLNEAISLTETMVNLFWDKKLKKFYDTGTDHEELLIRPSDLSDNALPSGSSMATYVLFRMSVITGDQEYENQAIESLKTANYNMTHFPSGAGHWLCALDFQLTPTKEIVVIGKPGEVETESLLIEAYRHYIPNRVLVGRDPSLDCNEDKDYLTHRIPLLHGRSQIGSRPTAYVCQDYVCKLPVTESNAFAIQLAG